LRGRVAQESGGLPEWVEPQYRGMAYFGDFSLPILVFFAPAAEGELPTMTLQIFGNDLVTGIDFDEQSGTVTISSAGSSPFLPSGPSPGIFQRDGLRLNIALGLPREAGPDGEDGGEDDGEAVWLPPVRPDDFTPQDNVLLVTVDPLDEETCPPLEEGDMPSLADLEPGVWRALRPGYPTGCGLRGDFVFFVRPGTGDAARNVVVEFSGGGACWKRRTCSSTPFAYLDDSFSAAVDCRSFAPPGAAGQEREGSPMEGFTYVWIPYCTQDIHFGDAVKVYEEEGKSSLEFKHYGFRNARVALKYVFENIQEPETVVSFGCSAGGYAAILYGGYMMKQYESLGTRVAVIADSSSGVLTQSFMPKMLDFWGASCGLMGYENFVSADYMAQLRNLDLNSFDDLFKILSERFPDNVIGTFTTVDDTNQQGFFREMHNRTDVADLAGTWTRLMLQKVQGAAAAAPAFRYFVEEGSGHCPSKSDAFYEWMYALIAPPGGVLPESVACEGCTAEEWLGCDGVTGSGMVRTECGDCVAAEDFTDRSLACVEDLGIGEPVFDTAGCTVDLDFFPPSVYNEDQVLPRDDDGSDSDDGDGEASGAAAHGGVGLALALLAAAVAARR